MRSLLVVCYLLAATPAFASTRTGTLRYLARDTIDPTSGQVVATVGEWRMARGKTHTMVVAPDPRFVPGALVKLRGRPDQSRTFVPNPDLTGVTILAKPPPRPAPAIIVELVIPISFADVAWERPWAEVAALGPKEAQVWANASYGHATHRTITLPIQFSPFRADDIACDLDQLTREAVRLATGQVDFRTVTTIDIVIPRPVNLDGTPRYCMDGIDHGISDAPGGLAFVGPVGLQTPDGLVMLGLEYNNEKWPMLAHETGHTLGLVHANSLDCHAVPAIPDDPAALCTNKEYGEWFDFMGQGVGDINALHKRQLGWLVSAGQPQQIATVPAEGSGNPFTGIWRISALDDAAVDPTSANVYGEPDVKALLLPLLTGTGGWLSLEARFVEGNDWMMNDAMIAGAIPHWLPPPILMPPHMDGAPLSPYQSLLLAPFGGTALSDQVLAVGAAYDAWPWHVTILERHIETTPKYLAVEVDDLRFPPRPPECLGHHGPCPGPTP